MTRPRVSIVVPVLNGATTVVDALKSVLAEPEVGEVVFVDDGSTDGSADAARALRDPRIRIIPGPRVGLAAVYNAGQAAAKFDYLAFCDQDDFYEGGRLAWQVEALDRLPDHVAVVGGFATTDQQVRVQVPLHSFEAERDVTSILQNGQTVSHVNAWLIRKSAADAIGGRRHWFEIGDDLDLQYRLASQGKVRFFPKNAYIHRLNDGSLTHKTKTEKMIFFAKAGSRFAQQRRDTGKDDLDRGVPPSFSDASFDMELRAARNHFSGHLRSHAHRLRQAGRYGSALTAASWAIRFAPLDRQAWLTLAGICKAAMLRRG